MHSVLKVCVAIVALAVAWRVGQIGRQANRPLDSTVPSSQRAPRAMEGGQFRGMAIQLHGGRDVYQEYHRLVPEVANLGANCVLLVVPGWQEHADTLDLHIDGQRTPDAEDVGKLCDLARRHGLRVILMPIVLLSNPRSDEWRGKIIPANRDWDAWFKRYSEFILHFAKTAERHHVEVFMVGSELIKTERYGDRWRRLIAEVRQHYRGELGYSANWDHYQTDKIDFWSELDYVGMTSYYELAGEPASQADESGAPAGKLPAKLEGFSPYHEPIDPLASTRREIDASWAKIKVEITAFARQVGKPIIFTEVGWCSQEGAAHEGWNYYANQRATEAGHREQALLYECFMKAWSDEPCAGGIIWWEWDTTPGGKNDYGYTPRGKLAETLLRLWFAHQADPKAVDILKAANGRRG